MKQIYNTYKIFWSYLPPKKTIFLLILFSKTFGTITSVLIPYTASGIIKYLTIGNYEATLKWIFYFFLTGTAKYFFYYWNYYGAALDCDYCYNNLKEKIFKKFATYDMEFLKGKDIDEILQASSSDVAGVAGINDNLSDVIITFLKIIIVIILTAMTSPIVGIIVFIFCALYIIVTAAFNKKIVFYLHKQRKYQDKIAGIFIEEMSSSEELKVYGMEEKYKSYFEKTNKNFCENYRKKRRFEDCQENFLQLILEMGEVVIYAVTVFLLFKNQYAIDKIVLVIGYFSMLINDMNYMLVNCVRNIVNKSISVERINNILNYKPKDDIKLGNDITDSIDGILEFKHVSSSYLNKQVLNNISFKIKPKEITAIVGRSGSGKSTIFNNILRLYQPNKGKILIDGKNIYEYQDDIYKSNVSVVSQKSFLFNMSIRDNLNLIDKNIKKQNEVCELLGIHEEILNLENGYNTIIENGGSNISTRLKQLISVARSILTKSEILLFDEVTSSLDVTTTKQIIKIFKKLSTTHTIVIITHKKEIMDIVDHLIIIDKGKKVADGTPKSLKNNKYYLNLKNSSSCDE